MLCTLEIRAAQRTSVRAQQSRGGGRVGRNKAPATLPPLWRVVPPNSSGAAVFNEKIQLGSKGEATQSMPGGKGGLPKVPAPRGTPRCSGP